MSGYGTDVGIFCDWKANMRVVSGARVVAEACVKRLLSTVFYREEYGYPILNELNASFRQGDLDQVASRIQTELLKDDRIADVEVSSSTSGSPTTTLTIDVKVTLQDSDETFELVIPVNSDGFSVDDLRIITF